MKKNIGKLDKILRIALAIVFAILYFSHIINGITAIVLLVLAGMLLLTSFVGTCPLYLPFGISTIKKK